MGQKTNPIGLRIAVNKDWRSKWYAQKKDFGKLLAEEGDRAGPCFLGWVPAHTGGYTVMIHNPGSTATSYRLVAR